MASFEGEPLYLHLARWAQTVSEHDNVGLVAGATRPEELVKIRAEAATLPLLVPGIGAQAGDLEATIKALAGSPYFINASRSITGASKGRDFADAAAEAAATLHQKITKAEGAFVGT